MNTTRLYYATRLPSSRNGNPRFQLHTSAGTLTTSSDAACGYDVENLSNRAQRVPGDRGLVVEYTTTRSGRVRTLRAAHDSTCATCGRTWDSYVTPTPAGRCPFEELHPVHERSAAAVTARIVLHADDQTTPRDFDCYEQDDITAWEEGCWSFVGITPIVTLAYDDGSTTTYEAPALWGLEYGLRSYEPGALARESEYFRTTAAELWTSHPNADELPAIDWSTAPMTTTTHAHVFPPTGRPYIVHGVPCQILAAVPGAPAWRVVRLADGRTTARRLQDLHTL